ncbi:MAG TPA: ATP-dependent helicase C-terminal domain-containing protein, partial [Xanthobacteraceae bacterium]|nr:ATP-dependent helicase C-terminal domain-containing protein [Xanthobacteraceae bacterium]
ARVQLACPLEEAEIEAEFGDAIIEATETAFDASAGALRARRVRRLGTLALSERTAAVEPGAEAMAALARAAAGRGIARLPWSAAQAQTLDRARFLAAAAPELWPDLSEERLAATAEHWLAPALDGLTALSQIDAGRLGRALDHVLPWELARRLEAEAPTHFVAPTGSRLAIDYAADGGPEIAVRVQELFGLDRHPSLAGGKLPLTVALLSPAHRPIQRTRDLPAFWRGSWREVRSEMRGRYPKHPWPEDPLTAPATTRVKPR